MGAQLWFHETPWQRDALAALQALQEKVVDEEYDLPSLISEQLNNARLAVEDSQTIGNPRDVDQAGYERLYRRALAGS